MRKKVTSTLKKKKIFYFYLPFFFLVFSLYRTKTNGFAPIQTRIDPDKFWVIKAHSWKPTQRLISLSPIQRSPARFLVVGEGFVKHKKRCVSSIPLQNDTIKTQRRRLYSLCFTLPELAAVVKMGKKTKKPGKGKEKTEKKTAKAEEKKARRESKKLSPEDDIDAILVSFSTSTNLFIYLFFCRE